MARSHATIYGSTWSPESSFRELEPAPQWLYIALLAQPDLNLCGVMPLIPARWARFAKGIAPPDVEALVVDLEDAGYVVTDQDTVELWVRQFMFHDRVLAQPQVAMAAAQAFGQVQSKRLRHLVTESLPPDLRGGWPDNLRGVKRDEAKALLEGCDAASYKPSVTPNASPSTSPNGTPGVRGDRLGLKEALAEGSGSGLGSGSRIGSSSSSVAADAESSSTSLARVAREPTVENGI